MWHPACCASCCASFKRARFDLVLRQFFTVAQRLRCNPVLCRHYAIYAVTMQRTPSKVSRRADDTLLFSARVEATEQRCFSAYAAINHRGPVLYRDETKAGTRAAPASTYKRSVGDKTHIPPAHSVRSPREKSTVFGESHWYRNGWNPQHCRMVHLCPSAG